MNLGIDFFLPLIDAALAEDVGSGDATTLATVGEKTTAEAEILARVSGVIAGLPLARAVFERVDPGLRFEADVEDGDAVSPDQVVARISGRARGILTAERTALNFLQHLSGIATSVSRMAARVEGTGTRILDTRKTVPGMRLLSKYAVRCGGGTNHRQGLFDMILIKENHIAAGGGIGPAVEKSRKTCPGLAVEVEVTSMDELEEALDAAPDRILLDNMTPSEVKDAVARVEERARSGTQRPEIEVSGDVNLENVREFALPGVDFISSGSLTHSAPALNLSLELRLRVPGSAGEAG